MFRSGLRSLYFDGILYTVIIYEDKLILYTGNIYDKHRIHVHVFSN